MIIYVVEGDVDISRLTLAQEAGDRGDYALATAAFARHLAPRREEMQKRLAARVQEARAELAKDGLHRRVPGICADLLFGIEAFLDFAVAEGALEAPAARSVLERARGGIQAAVDAQQDDQATAEPASKFLELLRSAFISGEAHVCARDGGQPADPGSWGWERVSRAGDDHGDELWRALGRRVGWVEGSDLYLDLNSAVRACQAVGGPTGDPLAVLPTTISRRLRERGYLKSVSPDGRHLTVQVVVEGGRQRVLHLDAGVFLDREPAAIATEAALAPEGESPAQATPGSDPVSAAPPPAASADEERQATWECFRCGGSDSWRARVNGDLRCRTCTPPVAGAEEF